MMRILVPGERFSFGPFSCQSRSYVLRCGSEEMMLSPRLFDLLVMLLREAGRVVTKDELARVLWPDQFVTDNNLAKAVSDLRRILKRYSGEEYIRTVPDIGYRFTDEPGVDSMLNLP